MDFFNRFTELEKDFSRIKKNISTPLRLYFQENKIINSRASLILGARGVGKTTLLLTEAKKNNLFYFSADHPLVNSIGIWAIAKFALENSYSGIAVDEVHFTKNWSQDLKAIYDNFPKAKIIASDSSSLILRKGVSDLSRRFIKSHIPLLSFREYLQLKFNIILPRASILDVKSVTHFLNELEVNNLDLNLNFKDYINQGQRPIFLEGEYGNRILNIIEKTIFSDVPFLLPQVNERHLRIQNAIIGHLANLKIPTLNIEKLSRDWSIGKEKVYELLAVLEHVELINIVKHKNDTKVSGKGAKIFFADPSFYHALGGEIGNQREALVVSTARQNKQNIFASKDEQEADFILEGKLIEVGGKSKKSKKSDILIRDDFREPIRNIMPLWALTLQY